MLSVCRKKKYLCMQLKTWVEKAAPEENPPRVMELESIDKTVGKVFPSAVR